MNRFVAYVAALAALVLFLLSGCGATVPKHVPVAEAPRVVAIREHAETLHADEGFTEVDKLSTIPSLYPI